MDPKNYMSVGNKDRELNEYALYMDLYREIGSELPMGEELTDISEKYNKKLDPGFLEEVTQGQEAIDIIKDSKEMNLDNGTNGPQYVDKGYNPWAIKNYKRNKRKRRK